MRGVIRGVVVVLVVGFSLAVGASPREREPRSGMIGDGREEAQGVGHELVDAFRAAMASAR
jgi:hypothetical protein